MSESLTHLLQVMNLPPSAFSDAVRTSDGFYLAQEQGDCGFNAFLGKPKPPQLGGPGPELSQSIWNGLTVAEANAVQALASGKNIDLADFVGSLA